MGNQVIQLIIYHQSELLKPPQQTESVVAGIMFYAEKLALGMQILQRIIFIENATYEKMRCIGMNQRHQEWVWCRWKTLVRLSLRSYFSALSAMALTTINKHTSSFTLT